MQIKNLEIVFCFSDNYNWIGIVRLSLLRTGYFSSAPNVIKSSAKIWHVNNRNFFRLDWLSGPQWILQRCCDADFKRAWALLPCCLSKGLLKKDFFDIYLTAFSQSVISEIQNLWGSSFYEKCLKFNLDFKNLAKNWVKVFCFWDNRI